MRSRTATITAIPEEGRQVRRRARTRAELLAAAKRLFASKGFHGTKIADIAAAADVGTGTFYLYFATKDALFADLVKETAIRAKEEMDRAKAPYPDPRDKARVGIETFFRFADANREVFKILFGHSAQFDTLLREVYQLFIADIEENQARGMAEGAFKPFRPAIVAQAAVGMLSHVVSWWVEHEDIAIEEITQTVYRMLAEGIAVKESRHE
jgi:AcrR family transcriptional regulator